jgi:ParB family chromosome partitioning protein
MTTAKRPALKELSPDQIYQNPANPRMFFRPEEMDTLLASIKRYGVQVPISVYQDGSRFILIDGERRWRCAKKLYLKQIPALVQEKPSPLENLLLMFNIHALREQWDYLTIAKSLPDVISLFGSGNGREPNEIELSELTGLTRGQIRRCKYLLELPKRYVKVLEQELHLPKASQQLSEDFFIEMERSLKTVQSRVPAAIVNLDNARDALISKFRAGTIGNITDFRKLSKIATSISNVGAKELRVRSALKDILDPNKKTGIEEVYAQRFELQYDQRKVSVTIDSIFEYLEIAEEHEEAIDPTLRGKLIDLVARIERVLGI